MITTITASIVNFIGTISITTFLAGVLVGSALMIFADIWDNTHDNDKHNRKGGSKK